MTETNITPNAILVVGISLRHTRDKKMKKVLFASTALIAFAGTASAGEVGNFTLSGEATAGIFHDDSTGITDTYNTAKIVIDMSGETDNGITFGASIDATAGASIDIDEVGTANFDAGGATPEAEGGTFGLGGVYVSGAFGKLTFDRDDIDNQLDDDSSHDIKYEYSVGDFSTALTFNLNDDGTDGDEWSAMLGYGAGDFSGSLTFDDTSEFKIDLGYDISDISLGLTYESDDDPADPADDGDVTTLSLGYDNGSFSSSVSFDTNDDWDLALGYTNGVFAVNASTDESDEWELTGSYDLGGGMSIVAGTAHTSNYYLGATMSF